MGKTPKVKVRVPSKHSRAARRAASPPLKDDTSPTHFEILPPSTQSSHASHYAGIKKKKKAKPLKHGQRIRQQKGLERAEVVMDQMEMKISRSEGRLQSVKDRRKDWENVNSNVTKGGLFGALLDLRDDEQEKSEKDSIDQAERGKENEAARKRITALVRGKAPEQEEARPLPGRGTRLQLALRPPPGILGPPSASAAAPAIEDQIN